MKQIMLKEKKFSILLQITILFVIGAVLIGMLSSGEMSAFSNALTMMHHEDRVQSVAQDLKGYLDRFPARDWLLQYWYEHYDELEIEYDAEYSADTLTAQQYRQLMDHQPDFSPEYAGLQDVSRLPEEDQKLYAEVTYSWLISRIDQINQAYNLSYVFGVVTEEPYDRQFLLFISANPGDIRGNGKGEVYPIGTELPITEDRQEAAQKAVAGEPLLSRNEDDKYIDYYYYVGSFDSHDVLIGMSSYVGRIDKMISRQTAVLRTISVMLLALLTALCLLNILFVVLRPLKAVQKSIRLYKDTKDSQMVAENLSKIRSHNEIAELSGDVAEMAEELTAYIKQNRQNAAKEERVRTELGLASRIQTAMLPTVFPPYPDRKDFEIFASMTPAKEVGGDFYDFFLSDDTHLCLVIADVSGKGVPAALYMMASKIMLSHLIKSGLSPAQVLAEANDYICSNNPEEMFVTVWLGILDLDTGKMMCANAGHEYPILKKPGQLYEIIKDKHGFVIGGINDVKYREYELQMDPGSSLFLYTDGLPEAVNPDNKMFGTAGILERLNAEPERSPEEILRDMKNAVSEYAQGMKPFDDLTMMCITYHGTEKVSS